MLAKYGPGDFGPPGVAWAGLPASRWRVSESPVALVRAVVHATTTRRGVYGCPQTVAGVRRGAPGI